MRTIDIDEWPYSNQDNPEAGMKRLLEDLSELADGDDLALLRWTDRDRIERTLVLAPMSRVEITLK